jgi:hypothetical protein
LPPRFRFRCSHIGELWPSPRATRIDEHFEIAIGEPVPSLGIFRVTIVNAQMPFSIFAESVQSDEFVLFVCGRLMSAPRAFTVRYEMSLFYELHRESKSVFV